MALNQYGTDPILADFQGTIAAGVLTTKAAYNGTMTYSTDGGGEYLLLTLNTGTSKKSALVQFTQFGGLPNEVDIRYPEDPVGGSPIGKLASNQILLTFGFGDQPAAFSAVVLNCNNVTA